MTCIPCSSLLIIKASQSITSQDSRCLCKHYWKMTCILCSYSLSIGSSDKGKIVNYLVLISLYLFCIFLFIIMVLCVVLVLQVKFGRKCKKWAKLSQKNTKLAKIYEAGKNLADTNFWETKPDFSFSARRLWETWHIVFWPLWLFKYIQNSSPRNLKSF